MVARIRENLEPMQKLPRRPRPRADPKTLRRRRLGWWGTGVPAAGVWHRKPVEPVGVRSPLGRPVRVKPAACVVDILTEAGHSG